MSALNYKNIERVSILLLFTWRLRDGSVWRICNIWSKSMTYKLPATMRVHWFCPLPYASSISWDVRSSYCHQPLNNANQSVQSSIFFMSSVSVFLWYYFCKEDEYRHFLYKTIDTGFDPSYLLTALNCVRAVGGLEIRQENPRDTMDIVEF